MAQNKKMNQTQLSPTKTDSSSEKEYRERAKDHVGYVIDFIRLIGIHMVYLNKHSDSEKKKLYMGFIACENEPNNVFLEMETTTLEMMSCGELLNPDPLGKFPDVNKIERGPIMAALQKLNLNKMAFRTKKDKSKGSYRMIEGQLPSTELSHITTVKRGKWIGKHKATNLFLQFKIPVADLVKSLEIIQETPEPTSENIDRVIDMIREDFEMVYHPRLRDKELSIILRSQRFKLKHDGTIDLIQTFNNGIKGRIIHRNLPGLFYPKEFKLEQAEKNFFELQGLRITGQSGLIKDVKSNIRFHKYRSGIWGRSTWIDGILAHANELEPWNIVNHQSKIGSVVYLEITSESHGYPRMNSFHNKFDPTCPLKQKIDNWTIHYVKTLPSRPSFFASEKELEEELIKRLEKKYSKDRVESQLSVTRMGYSEGGFAKDKVVVIPDVTYFNNEYNYLYELKKGENESTLFNLDQAKRQQKAYMKKYNVPVIVFLVARTHSEKVKEEVKSVNESETFGAIVNGVYGQQNYQIMLATYEEFNDMPVKLHELPTKFDSSSKKDKKKLLRMMATWEDKDTRKKREEKMLKKRERNLDVTIDQLYKYS